MTLIKRVTLSIAAVGLSLGVAGCDVDKTQEGEAPEVEVREGQMPRYDVEGPDVDVQTQRKTIETPNVDVRTEEREVEVPSIDVETPNE